MLKWPYPNKVSGEKGIFDQNIILLIKLCTFQFNFDQNTYFWWNKQSKKFSIKKQIETMYIVILLFVEQFVLDQTIYFYYAYILYYYYNLLHLHSFHVRKYLKNADILISISIDFQSKIDFFDWNLTNICLNRAL